MRQRALSPSDQQLSLSQAAIRQPPTTVHAGASSAACCARCSRLGRGAGAAALPQRAGAAAVLPQRRHSGTVCRSSSSAAVSWSGRRTAAGQQRRRLGRGGVGRAAAAHPAHPAPELEGRKRAGALSQVAGRTLTCPAPSVPMRGERCCRKLTASRYHLQAHTPATCAKGCSWAMNKAE